MSLHRREVVKKLLEKRGDLLVIAGLGSTAWDITAAGDSPLSFPLWGAMGQAAMMGLGLALAQPKRRVLVITGDGEMLMGLGSLATIGPPARSPGGMSAKPTGPRARSARSRRPRTRCSVPATRRSRHSAPRLSLDDAWGRPVRTPYTPSPWGTAAPPVSPA